MSETYVMDNCETQSFYVNDKIPAEIAEHLKEILPEHGDLSYEELLLQQESAYYYIQSNFKNKDKTSDSNPTSSRGPSPVQECESSHSASVESQLALDEALARCLQELGEDSEDFIRSEHSDQATESRESNPRETTPARVTSHNFREDDFDPDNMTYEELQSLGEAVGNESRGLSEDLISRLPTFKYRTGSSLFSKKKKKEDCVICYLEYRNGARLITLPCAHQYHAACISRWLKLNKICPVCQVEVREE